MNEPIEEAYFNWLCAKVLEIDNGNYITLLKILHSTEFVWVVSGDRHRAVDGLEVRRDFIDTIHISPDPIFMEQPCSVLELLVAFSKRAAFQTDMPARVWFWQMLNNLKLDEYRKVSRLDAYEIEDILYTFIWRQYDPNGLGGLFPLSRTENDQRKVEIWYQFFEYIRDRGIM